VSAVVVASLALTASTGPRTSRRPALARVALGVVWIVCLLVATGGLTYAFSAHVLGLDSRAYWLSGRLTQLYGAAPGQDDAYLYSPAFATILWPFTRLPVLAFESLWMIVEGAAFAWLLKPLGWRWGVPLFAVCCIEAIEGDIYGLMGVAAVLGMRYGATWAFLLLTKIAPGLGLVWFAVRREWRCLAWALGATLAIAAMSFIVAPGLWIDWVRFLQANRSGGSLLFPLRFALALGLTVVAAKTGRPWLLAPAMMLAMPRAGNLPTYTMLAAIPRLRQYSARYLDPPRNASRSDRTPADYAVVGR
jgi:hypothetical protein